MRLAKLLIMHCWAYDSFRDIYGDPLIALFHAFSITTMSNRTKQILFATLGALLGSLVGAMVFVGGGYALAELFGIDNRETQAYFRVLVAMPLGALIGLMMGAAGMAVIFAKRKGALLFVALAGVLLLTSAGALGVYWETPKRPAQFRVRNETRVPLERVYLGHDFRRASSLGSLAPAATSKYYTVDLDERGSFNAVRALYRGGQIQLTLDLSRQTSLTSGRYTYVVSEQENKARLDLVLE